MLAGVIEIAALELDFAGEPTASQAANDLCIRKRLMIIPSRRTEPAGQSRAFWQIAEVN